MLFPKLLCHYEADVVRFRQCISAVQFQGRDHLIREIRHALDAFRSSKFQLICEAWIGTPGVEETVNSIRSHWNIIEKFIAPSSDEVIRQFVRYAVPGSTVYGLDSNSATTSLPNVVNFNMANAGAGAQANQKTTQDLQQELKLAQTLEVANSQETRFKALLKDLNSAAADLSLNIDQAQNAQQAMLDASQKTEQIVNEMKAQNECAQTIIHRGLSRSLLTACAALALCIGIPRLSILLPLAKKLPILKAPAKAIGRTMQKPVQSAVLANLIRERYIYKTSYEVLRELSEIERNGNIFHKLAASFLGLGRMINKKLDLLPPPSDVLGEEESKFVLLLKKPMRIRKNKNRNFASGVLSVHKEEEEEESTSLFRNWRKAFSRQFNSRCCWRLSPTEYSVQYRVHPGYTTHSQRTLLSDDNCFADVTLSKCLGAGGSGTVYSATLHNQIVAVKILDCIQAGFRIPEEFMSTLRHPNLVRIYSIKTLASLNDDDDGSSINMDSYSSLHWDTFSSESFTELTRDIPTKHGVYNPSMEAWIMMEYCDLGSLSSYIQRTGFLTEKQHVDVELFKRNLKRIMIIMKQIAEAMVYLHKSGIVHSDLKSQNIFLKTSPESQLGFIAKIGDFGNCRQPNKTGFVKTMSWGTVDHMPPEVLRDNEVRFASDVFSFGMILWECMTASRPFSSQSSASILIAIVEGYRPEIPTFVPRNYATLIKDCWHQDWWKRPNFKDIVRRLKTMLSKLE
eukprot:g5271.t1